MPPVRRTVAPVPETDLNLPRSVVAALWLPHVTTLGEAERAARAITGDDEPHVALLGRAQLNWPALIARLAPARSVVAALPVPGDPAGVPAPPAAEAIDAGECLLVAARTGAFAVVPQVRRFGSPLEPGAHVTWHVHEVPDVGASLGGAVGSLADARVALVEALATATSLLERMDIAGSRPEAAARLAMVSSGTPSWDLPSTVGAERLDLLERAARLLAIIDVATADDGAAASAWQAGRRATALRDVRTAARRAMSAATLTHR